MAVGVFGVAFVIAFITQAQNGFSNRWHNDLKAEDRSKAEKYIVYTLGHLGFLARAGVNIYVADQTTTSNTYNQKNFYRYLCLSLYLCSRHCDIQQ